MGKWLKFLVSWTHMGDMEEALALAWHSSGHIGYLEENQQREDLCLSLFLFMFAFQINNNKFF